ncbi:MAG: hypothetical protein HYY09_05790 [Firmicutes bacterium]|nr:hypothetical protein [Bacillota bacterium]
MVEPLPSPEQSPELELLDSLVDSFAKLDLITYFHGNPWSMDTAEGLARHIGRPLEKVEESALALTRQGVLKVFQQDHKPVYSFNSSTQTRVIDKFLAFYSTPDGRLVILTRLLQSGSAP